MLHDRRPQGNLKVEIVSTTGVSQGFKDPQTCWPQDAEVHTLTQLLGMLRNIVRLQWTSAGVVLHSDLTTAIEQCFQYPGFRVLTLFACYRIPPGLIFSAAASLVHSALPPRCQCSGRGGPRVGATPRASPDGSFVLASTPRLPHDDGNTALHNWTRMPQDKSTPAGVPDAVEKFSFASLRFHSPRPWFSSLEILAYNHITRDELLFSNLFASLPTPSEIPHVEVICISIGPADTIDPVVPLDRQLVDFDVYPQLKEIRFDLGCRRRPVDGRSVLGEFIKTQIRHSARGVCLSIWHSDL
ncbi:hypothetical protein FB45DRAFT_864639 [Roridomyces roridus]|uniref:Uncharacterized protein n=1 Tax=Roridomyces roridus TaxID=1738132 RepID=A0AAD7FQ32_9AGAR|nr:hypothetical protein FB45DRAFT_864639 [Roridomyces roridus]